MLLLLLGSDNEWILKLLFECTLKASYRLSLHGKDYYCIYLALSPPPPMLVFPVIALLSVQRESKFSPSFAFVLRIRLSSIIRIPGKMQKIQSKKNDK